MAKINKYFFKITFQDMNIAKEFFDNDKHYIEWLYLVSEYYQGNILSSKVKIIQKYFTSYKKTIDFVINSKEEGRKGFDKRVENQRLKNKTLDGYLQPPLSTHEPTLDANNKLLTINNKLLITNDKQPITNDYLKNLLLEKSEWIETMSIESKKSKEEVKNKLDVFLVHLSTELKTHPSLHEFAKHFKNWLPKNINNGTIKPTEQLTPEQRTAKGYRNHSSN